MFCPQCGHRQVSDETRFCPRCGLSLGLVTELLDKSVEVTRRLAGPVSLAETTTRELR